MVPIDTPHYQCALTLHQICLAGLDACNRFRAELAEIVAGGELLCADNGAVCNDVTARRVARFLFYGRILNVLIDAVAQYRNSIDADRLGIQECASVPDSTESAQAKS